MASNLNPPNGTVVAQTLGFENYTFECDVSDNGVQTFSQWNLANYRGVKGLQGLTFILPDVILSGTLYVGGVFPTYRNHLTFPTFIAELHDTTLYCGSGDDAQLAEFYLRVYCKKLYYVYCCKHSNAYIIQ